MIKHKQCNSVLTVLAIFHQRKKNSVPEGDGRRNQTPVVPQVTDQTKVPVLSCCLQAP